MRTIHKYLLPDQGKVMVPLRGRPEILGVAYQGAQLVLWAIDDPEDGVPVGTIFHVLMTGQSMPKHRFMASGLMTIADVPLRYVGTAMCPHGSVYYVAHVFVEEVE